MDADWSRNLSRPLKIKDGSARQMGQFQVTWAHCSSLSMICSILQTAKRPNRVPVPYSQTENEKAPVRSRPFPDKTRSFCSYEIAKVTKRTPGALRQKASNLGMPLGH